MIYFTCYLKQGIVLFVSWLSINVSYCYRDHYVIFRPSKALNM